MKSKIFFTARTKCNIAGLVATILGIYFVYFFIFADLIRTPFKILHYLELTNNYHSALALISFLIVWSLLSNLPFMALRSKKDGRGEYKLVIALVISAGLIVYTGSVVAHNFALDYVYMMP